MYFDRDPSVEAEAGDDGRRAGDGSRVLLLRADGAGDDSCDVGADGRVAAVALCAEVDGLRGGGIPTRLCDALGGVEGARPRGGGIPAGCDLLRGELGDVDLNDL